MSLPSLSSEVQLRYLLQWFSEFSELQREDFLPVLAAAKDEDCDQLAAALALLNCQDKPVSLFQCRLKLFNDWYPTWSEDQRGRLIKGITEQDTDFAKKLQEFKLPNGKELNGEFNGIHEVIEKEPIVEVKEELLVKEDDVQESIPELDETFEDNHGTVEENTAEATEPIEDEKVTVNVTTDS